MKNFGTKSFLIAMAFLFTLSAHAASAFLATITTDSDDDEGTYTYFFLNIDAQSNALSFQRVKYELVGNLPATGDPLVENLSYTLVDYSLNSNIKLVMKKSREIVNLRSSNFTNADGGTIVVDYLHNGISGRREETQMQMVKRDGVWGLFQNGRKISKIHFEVKKQFPIGEVGIKQANFSF